VDGERAALAVEGDLGLEAELGGEVALQRLGVGILFARLFTVLKRLAFFCCARRSASDWRKIRSAKTANNCHHLSAKALIKAASTGRDTPV
jgi:hypothetical protein